MFFVDFTLLIISIIMAYQGRNIPAEFNYSKKIFEDKSGEGFHINGKHI